MAFSESLLNSEPSENQRMDIVYPFWGIVKGLFQWSLIQFFISQGMQLNIILKSFYLLNPRNIAVIKFSYSFIKPFSK